MVENKPAWLRASYNKQAVEEISRLMAERKLNTVCKEANCPNLGECYKRRTATFMILGNFCTRNCRFCNVVHGKPLPVDPEEPMHLAQAAETLGLRHVVVTSVTRDDLPDGGAQQFARVIQAVRERCPHTTVEVLIPDLQGDAASLEIVLDAHPDVLNHNIETVRDRYPTVRPQANYERSLTVLRRAKQYDSALLTKTGMMVGLGETPEQVEQAMDDILAAGCDILTIGQYLRPSPQHLAVQEYITPEQFAYYKEVGCRKGFRYVASGPLVRSSYHAEEALRNA